MKEKGNRSFLGVGWQFPPEIDRSSSGFSMVGEELDIEESIMIILSTKPGERIMKPNFGCGIHSLVFEELDAHLLTLIKDRISNSLLEFESRISVERIDVSSPDSLEGRLDVHIDYTIRSTNTRKNIVYPFYLREGTDIAE